MEIPTDRKYSETHEWFLLEGDIVTMGITQYAADELTDITYVELPEVGTSVKVGDQIGEVESVKATSDITTAVGGEVIEVNAALVDHPELINDDAFDEGWMLKLRPDSSEPLGALMDAKEYTSFVSNAS
jgi:glycine cleavage system H protein